ncbi:hypothetical protein FGG08_007228 [Glutinoglossum americanum]|uniref:HTH lacI-type domain-containing protein n=1 Tax=Glutinoglossum americanum TaxID=1670608 RepID=A0A9P8HR81_9PEZI|nr:hypothetical protein FGG08_007228 [Glutinoglossum americanum]
MPDQPLVTHLYTADPSAHVFDGRVYVYPSHDRETPIADNDNGDQYDMVDYHVLSLEVIGGPVTDHGVALALEDVPWASKQLWAPDAATKDGLYYLYFPARDKDGIFRIGVAVSSSPEGPFVAEPEPIAGSYSIDPCSFVDDDGQAYLYFGGIWGGQLQCWQSGTFDPAGKEPSGNVPALLPRVAKLSEDMRSFSSEVLPLSLLDTDSADSKLLGADDHDRRFFEAAWMHKYNGVYYFSYSTGDTHYLVYATGDNPLGPFTYRGRILEPVLGWTTHHSIVEFNGKWYLFHHDASLSGGKNHLRCVKAGKIFIDTAEQQRIRPETQRRVLEVARELGYRANASARAIRAGRFRNIAFVQSLLGQYLPRELMMGITRAIADQDMHLVLSQVPDRVIDDESYLPHTMRELSADGVLLYRNFGFTQSFLEQIHKSHIPAIFLNVKQASDCIYPDDFMGGRLATEYLLSLGHERIAYVDTKQREHEHSHYSQHDTTGRQPGR